MKPTRKILLIAAFIILCLFSSLLFEPFTSETTPTESFLAEEGVCLFTSDAGETAQFQAGTPSQNFDAPRADGVYTFQYTVPKLTGSAVLHLRFGLGQAAMSAGGEKLYAGETFSNSQILGTPSVQVTVDTGQSAAALTVQVRYTDPNNYIFPPLVSVESQIDQITHSAAIVNSMAIPAGIGICVFLIVTGLFLISLYISRPDCSLLILGLGSLAYSLNCLIGTGAMNISSLPSPLGSILEPLLFYVQILSVLIYVFLNRKKPLLRYFLVILTLLSALILLAHSLTLAADNVPDVIARTGLLANMLYSGHFSAAVHLCTQYLVFICCASAILQHVTVLAEIRVEESMTQSQAQAIHSGYENMMNNVKRTAAVRHEWKNDLLTLGVLYEQGRIDELGAYLKKKNAQLSEIDRMLFTENYLFDVILSSASARAAETGIRFDTTVNVPRRLNIRDEDLSSLLMNLFDNAFNACAKLEPGKRFIIFSAELKGSFLTIQCSNSTPDTQQRDKNDLSHGWGLKNMQEICRRYGSELLITSQGGVFTVKTALQLPPEGSDAE